MWESDEIEDLEQEEPQQGIGALPGGGSAPMGSDAPRPKKNLRKVKSTFTKAKKARGFWQNENDEEESFDD